MHDLKYSINKNKKDFDPLTSQFRRGKIYEKALRKIISLTNSTNVPNDEVFDLMIEWAKREVDNE